MRTQLSALVLLALNFLTFLVLNQFLNPHPDMLDHWVWSRFLSASYYEHPPMVAFLLRLLTTIGGHHEITLEIGAQLINLFILYLIFRLSLAVFHPKAALFTMLVLSSMPYFTLGTVFLHITQPFVICWVLALMLLVRYHREPHPRWLIWIGIVCGLGALSKFIMLLFYIGLFFHALIYKDARSILKSPWLYMAGVISLTIFSPVIFWNATHDWISFRFQFGRGMGGEEFGENTFHFLIGHILLFSPLWATVGWLGLTSLKDRLRSGKHPESVILVLSLYPVFFFTIMSLRGSIADPHWTNLFYLGLAILLGQVLSIHWKKYKLGLVSAALFINASLITAAVVNTYDPLYEWEAHELDSPKLLLNDGVPEEVINKLEANHTRLYSFSAFEKFLEEHLTEPEIKAYGDQLRRVSHDTFGNRFNQFLQWPETVDEIRRILQAKGFEDPDYIVSREYQLSSALSFYFPNHPWPHSLEKPERNLWSPRDEVKNSSFVFVCALYDCDHSSSFFEKSMGVSLDDLGEVLMRQDGRLIRALRLYVPTNLVSTEVNDPLTTPATSQ
jgi:hypothetical protein